MVYKIPLFKLNFNHLEEEAVVSTLKSKWISIGPKCNEFEQDFSKMLNSSHAISLSNCTSALHLSLLALNIKEGDEVLCPSLTFAATVNSIKYINAIPIFCDIDSVENPTISVEDIKKKITPKTKAIILMHFAGYSCDMTEIMAVAKKNNIKVIEDACHSPLSEYKNQKLGTIGDIGCFSFFSNKNISTGEGGMIVTNNHEIDKRIRLLRSHGMTTMSYDRSKGHATTYDIESLGYNARMDDIRASIGIVQLKKLKPDLEKRKVIRAKYIELLKDTKSIDIPFSNRTDFSSNYIFPIVLKDSTNEKRDKCRERLHKKGIQTSLHYPSIHLFSIYKNDSVPLPITEYFSNNTMTLPMYGSLTSEEIIFICTTLNEILNEL